MSRSGKDAAPQRRMAAPCALAIMALLAGCAEPVSYRVPAGSPSAHLTLVGRGVGFQAIDERDCTQPRTTLADLRPDFFSLSLDDLAAQTDIEAERWMGLRATSGTCSVGTRFRPRAGEHYEARFDLIGPYCRLRVTHIVPAADGRTQRVPEPSAEPAEHFCGR